MENQAVRGMILEIMAGAEFAPDEVDGGRFMHREARMLKGRDIQAGFSMVELLVAVAILAVGLLGLAELQVTAMRANSQSEGMVAASALAKEIVEEVAALAPDNPTFNAAVNNATWAGSPFTLAGGGKYDVTYSVATNHQGVTNLCLVTVTVSSQNESMSVFGMRRRTVEMTTLKRSI